VFSSYLFSRVLYHDFPFIGFTLSEETIKNLDQKGIYSFIFPNNKRYIGSTKKSFIGRLNNHIDKLKSNNHTNEYFQNAYNKYKEDISFEILEIICEDVEKREEYWIDYFNASKNPLFYNLSEAGVGNLLGNSTTLGKTWTCKSERETRSDKGKSKDIPRTKYASKEEAKESGYDIFGVYNNIEDAFDYAETLNEEV